MNKGPPKILIVDDDPLAIQSLHNVLEGQGEIRFATSGQQAMQRLSEEVADLVLMDANMPELDGYATCRLLKAEYPDTPVIFVTAANDPQSEVRALDAGAVDFISKPLNPPVIRARVRTQMELKRNSDMLRRLTRSDALTGIANRRHLDEQLEQEWRRAMRHRHPLFLLMIDIDFFKPYNDFYGHPEGDNTLRRVAETIAANVARAGDLAARFGGEEFAVLLPNCLGEQAQRVAEKIRQAVEALQIPHARSETSAVVTVSIGVGGGIPRYPPQPSTVDEFGRPLPATPGGGDLNAIDELTRRADNALYAAKAQGRNQVVCSESG